LPITFVAMSSLGFNGRNFNKKNMAKLTKNDNGKQIQPKLGISDVSGSLASQKAIEYAKFIHGEEYDDPIFAPDVEQTIRDFTFSL